MKQHNPAKAMIVAGVMSGTSADGVDVAVCRISPGKDGVPRLKVLASKAFASEKRLRAEVLAVAGGEPRNAAEMSRLSWRLGAVYAECVEETVAETGVKIALVACHGQTVYHQGTATKYLGAQVRCTWQMGEASVIAERLRVPVVSDFRPTDMAAGGQGAPLVPMLDWCIFRHATVNRVLLNLGGIANVTALPAGCNVDGVLAFDTGPANMVVDAVMQQLYGRSYDRGGAVAAKGKVLGEVVAKLSRIDYFSDLPPKSCGREEFGAAFVAKFIADCQRLSPHNADIVATAMELTIVTVFDAYVRYCLPHFNQHKTLGLKTTVIVAGGGAKNAKLIARLQARFAAIGVTLITTEVNRIKVDAKEAAAFALLGWLTWHGMPGNVPSATGANRALVLGKVTYA